MKITEKTLEVNANHILNIGVDVSSRKLDVHFECPLQLNKREVYREQILNRSVEIEEALKNYLSLAQSKGFLNLRIVCEPTGPYSLNLLSMATHLNCLTAYVSGEAVKNSKIIEFNGTNKNDLVDAELINSLAERNKVLIHRTYSANYTRLRMLNSHYEDVDKAYVSARNQVHNTLKQLWPDYSSKLSLLYASTGQALYRCYGFNPWKIVSYNYSYFERRMRTHCKGVWSSTLKQIYRDAEESVRNHCSDAASTLESILSDHYENCLRGLERKASLKTEMKTILSEIREQDDRIPQARVNFISEFHIARLLAETGPLSDFKNLKQLTKYLGLNLRERQSGEYQGRVRLSKRGRSLARKILSLVVLPLTTQKALYGPDYHRIKTQKDKPGKLVMCIFMKRFLKSFFGIYRSHQSFDSRRLFIDRGSYEKLNSQEVLEAIS